MESGDDIERAAARFVPEALRELDRRQLDGLLKGATRQNKESLKRHTGCSAAVGALLVQARSGMSLSQLQVMSALLVAHVVDTARRLLGDAANDPTVHQLDEIVDQLIDDFGAEATRLMLALVHDDRQAAGPKAGALLVHRSELRLAGWDASDLEDEAATELSELRTRDRKSAAGGVTAVDQADSKLDAVERRSEASEGVSPPPGAQAAGTSFVGEGNPSVVVPTDVDGLALKLDDLRQRIVAAVAPVEAAAEALRQGTLPASSLEAGVVDIRRAFAQVQSAVGNQAAMTSVEVGDLTSLSELESALTAIEHGRSAKQLRSGLAPIERLGSLVPLGDDGGASRRIRDLAAETIAAIRDHQLEIDSEQAALLRATTRLVELVESEGAAKEVTELSNQVSQLLGDDAYVIAMHRLSFSGPSRESGVAAVEDPPARSAAPDVERDDSEPNLALLTDETSLQADGARPKGASDSTLEAGRVSAPASEGARAPDQAVPRLREPHGAGEGGGASESAFETPEEATAAQPKPVGAPEPGLKVDRAAAKASPSADGEDAGSGQPDSASTADAEALLVDAVAAGRLGLCSWLLEADGRPVAAAAARLLALAAAIQRPTGACLSRFNDEAQQLETTSLLEDRSSGLITIAAAMRVALVAPYSAAPTLLRDLTAFTAGVDGLDDLTAGVLRSASHGIQAADVRIGVTDQDDLQDDVSNVSKEAAALLETGSNRRIKFDRATRVWWSWAAPEGELGMILEAAAMDRREQVEQVADRVAAYRKGGALSDLIDDTDSNLRSKTARGNIEAGARTKLLEWAEEYLSTAEAWINAAMTAKLAEERHGSKHEDELMRLRRAVDDHGEMAVAAVSSTVPTGEAIGTAALVSAAADVLARVLTSVSELQPLAGDETSVGAVLGVDLLRSPTIRMQGWYPVCPPDVASLASAVRSTAWVAAFEARTALGDFVAAEKIVEQVRRTDTGSASKLDLILQRRLLEERAAVHELEHHVAVQLSAGRRHGYVSEADLGAFEGRLQALDTAEREDLDVIRTELDELLRDLALGRESAVRASLVRLDLLADEHENVREHRDRVARVIADGNLATAEDMLALLESGQTLVGAPQRDPWGGIERFYPGFVERVSDLTLDGALPTAAAEGAAWNGLQFEHLRSEQRPAVASALRGWLALGDAKRRNELADSLRPVLTALGLQVAGDAIRRPVDLKGGDTWNWLEVSGARQIGHALVPQLGSMSNGRYRFLVVWGRPDPERLLEFLDGASQDVPVFVLHLGTIGVDDRQRLADEARPMRRGRSVLLIDDAALLFLLLHGSGRFDLVARLTLPFTAINPYTPFVAGNVPTEVFYGRQPELASLVDPHGTSFIYGGRQLGKSALLRAAERVFREQSREHLAVYLDLKTHGIGAWRRKDEIWPLLIEALIEQGADLEAGTDSDDVLPAIREWLLRSDHRVLALFDEADAFLEADAAEQFASVSALKGLMEDTGRRFKPVFAGLHQVQRFLKIPNQPLAHLGRPISIGPLRPDAAHDLVAEPLGALGYQLQSDDIVNRILAYANYQPSIIQLFGDAICRQGLNKPRLSGPPYKVTSQQLETVYADREFADHVRHRFELTINLDPRYRVIAYTVALAAHDSGADVTVDWRELEKRCRTWWPRGFRDESGIDGFRSLLDELVGLGILARPGNSRYRLRSPNVLRMLGSSAEIEDTLLRAEELEPPQRFEAASFRRALGRHRESRSPLTESQLAELTVIENRTQLVVGSRALGVDHVQEAVRAVIDADHRIEFRKRNLSSGKFPTGFLLEEWKGHRVVLGDLRGATTETCRSTLQQAAAATSAKREGSLGILLVLGTEELPVWRELLTQEEPTQAAAPVMLGLRRWDDSAVRVWVQDADLDLRSEQSRSRLLEVTGGWPTLIAQLAAETDGGKRLVSSLLDQLEERLADTRIAAKLVAATGLLDDERIRTTWTALLEYGYFPLNDVEAVADVLETSSEEADQELAVLRALQVIVPSRDGADLVPEPVIRRAWESAAAEL